MKYREAICKAAEKYSSFYLYDEQNIIEHVANLKRCFPSVEFLYSLKCNPHNLIVSSIISQGLGIDAASVGEVEFALNHGLKKDKIFYSAPGKSKSDIQNTLDKAILIADSISEIERIRNIVEKSGQPVEIGIRINPEFTFDGEGGIPSKFGVDESIVFDFLEKNKNDQLIKIAGIHIHIKSQELSAEKLNKYYENIFCLVEKIEQTLGSPLSYINFGSGIGIPYALEDESVNLDWLGKQMEQHIHLYRETHSSTRILIEVGRYAVGKSGVYVTHVVDRKISHGKTYLILQNTLNGFMRPSIAKLLEKYIGDKDVSGTEPLFTGFDSFQIKTIIDSPETEVVTVVGNLCTSADIIAENIRLPKLDEGDLVIITNAGSYAAALSPMQFSTQVRPEQLVFTLDGQLKM